jgi:hypothetical protein
MTTRRTMSTQIRSLSLYALLTLVLATPLAAQQAIPAREVAPRTADVPATRSATVVGESRGMTRLRMGLVTGVGSSAVGGAGMVVGFLSDLHQGSSAACGSPAIILPGDPECFNRGRRLGAGWYVGTVSGAFFGAYAASGRLEACRHRSRRVRFAGAVGAALLGAAPGLTYLAAHGNGYEGKGVALAATTPITQSLAAAWLLESCAPRG